MEICEAAEAHITRLETPSGTEKVRRLSDQAPVALEGALEFTATKTLGQRLKTATAVHQRSALLCGSVVGLAGVIALFAAWLDNVSYDLSFAWRSRSGPQFYSKEVEFVTMDDDSLNYLNQKSDLPGFSG